MNELIKNQIDLLPHSPGVYLMYNEDNTIIYIGKAKDLNKRVSQYFLRPQEGKVLAMVMHVHHFDFILTKNEKEAFILEMNLIQKHYPRYNILLKDDKHYPYIALKKIGDPFLKIARHNNSDKYFYFGPYPSSKYAYQIIDLLNRIFPLRKCRNIPSKPCLYFHLNECLAPCINKINDDTFAKLLTQIRDFLNGKNDEIYLKYKKLMLEESEKLNYEKAKEYKEILDSINHIKERQNVETLDKADRDFFSYSSRENYLALSILIYRNGVLIGKDSFVVEKFLDEEEQVIDLILQYYQNHDLPQEIIINLESARKTIEQIYNVKVLSISKGKLFEITKIAHLNATQALDNFFMSSSLKEDKDALLKELGNLLKIKTPYRIELFDNSHLQGDASIGAMVVFINGEPYKKMYRHFHIANKEKRDDYASMKEVVGRRYKRLIENGDVLPDLILVDGGAKQVKVAIEALKKLSLTIPCFGLYKNAKHQTKGLIDEEEKEYPISNKNLFFLLVKMQDEVHRYAISFHHSIRNKNYRLSILSNIEGLGIKRLLLLENTYRSLDEIKNASIIELEQILPRDVAIKVYERLHENK